MSFKELISFTYVPKFVQRCSKHSLLIVHGVFSDAALPTPHIGTWSFPLTDLAGGLSILLIFPENKRRQPAWRPGMVCGPAQRGVRTGLESLRQLLGLSACRAEAGALRQPRAHPTESVWLKITKHVGQSNLFAD